MPQQHPITMCPMLPMYPIMEVTVKGTVKNIFMDPVMGISMNTVIPNMVSITGMILTDMAATIITHMLDMGKITVLDPGMDMVI